MNAFQLLDRTLRFDGVLVGDSEYPRRRLVHLEWAQEFVDQFYLLRPWTWRIRPVTLNIAANVDFVILPTDFVEFSAVGSVMDTINKQPVTEVSPIIIERLKQAPARSVHDQFAVYTKTDATSGDPGPLRFQIAANGAAQVFVGAYSAGPPTLVDVDAENSGLDRIPVAYHFSVILPKLKSKIQYANEAMRDYYEGEAQRGIEEAIRIDGEGRHSGVQAMPSAVPGMW